MENIVVEAVASSAAEMFAVWVELSCSGSDKEISFLHFHFFSYPQEKTFFFSLRIFNLPRKGMFRTKSDSISFLFFPLTIGEFGK